MAEHNRVENQQKMWELLKERIGVIFMILNEKFKSSAPL